MGLWGDVCDLRRDRQLISSVHKHLLKAKSIGSRHFAGYNTLNSTCQKINGDFGYFLSLKYRFDSGKRCQLEKISKWRRLRVAAAALSLEAPSVLQTFESYTYSSFPTHRTFTWLKWSTGDSKQDRDSHRITMHVVTSAYAGMITNMWRTLMVLIQLYTLYLGVNYEVRDVPWYYIPGTRCTH